MPSGARLSLGYVAPAASRHVGKISITCAGVSTSPPGALMRAFHRSPFHQITSGDAIPPSCTDFLYRRKGVLLTCAQEGPQLWKVSRGPGLIDGLFPPRTWNGVWRQAAGVSLINSAE